jgi:hypothetical protein
VTETAVEVIARNDSALQQGIRQFFWMKFC